MPVQCQVCGGALFSRMQPVLAHVYVHCTPVWVCVRACVRACVCVGVCVYVCMCACMRACMQCLNAYTVCPSLVNMCTHVQ